MEIAIQTFCTLIGIGFIVGVAFGVVMYQLVMEQKAYDAKEIKFGEKRFRIYRIDR